MLIARGAHAEAMREDGLRLVTPSGTHTLRLPVHRLLDERRRWIRAPETADKTLGTAGGFFSTGRFYRDPVSHEAAVMRLGEPRVYALIAKLPIRAAARPDRSPPAPQPPAR